MNPIDNLNLFSGRDELVEKISNSIKKKSSKKEKKLDI